MKAYVVVLYLYRSDIEDAEIQAVCSSKEKAEEILHKLDEYYANAFVTKPISEWEKGEHPIYFDWDFYDLTIDEYEMDTFINKFVLVTEGNINDQNRQSSSGSDTSD